MNNPHNLPAHLVGMTQAKWDALSQSERNAQRDNSELHPALIGLEGYRIKCQRDGKARTFRVGISTGWRPIHLAVRGDARGSSDVIKKSEQIDAIRAAI